jgi:uncharacterized protein YndB with AHSA1/START domain
MISENVNDRAHNEIVSERTFGFPRHDVFAAFSDPAKLVKWWGPEGFTNTIGKFDLRPGGRWEIIMHAPDGTDYANVSEFIEVIPDERIVYDHLDPVHRFTMTMVFTDIDHGCRLCWTMNFQNPEEAEKLGDFISTANQQNFDRLAAVLQSNA